MREKDIIMLSKVLSAVFSPFYLPVVGLLALFTFSYLSLLHWPVKLYIFIVVFLFTVMLPTTLIRLYARYQGWSKQDMAVKDNRMIPYVISILCYFCCYYTLNANHIPYSIKCIVVASLMIQVLCAIINLWWKISTHTAAIGGVMGAVIAFAEVFSFNPVWWICLVLIMGGIVGTSRLILKLHTLSEVLAGFFLGIICSFVSILFF